MLISIDVHSQLPIYQKVVVAIEEMVRSGKLKEGEYLPSMNELSFQNGISMETVKKAYNILKDKGVLDAYQGKGFYVAAKDPFAPKRILLLFDKLSSYKLTLYRSFVESLYGKSDITINLYNQEIEQFERMLHEALDTYDYYIITPHFAKDISPIRVRKAISQIPNKKLIILDKEIAGLHGNISRVVQDFSKDAYDGLKQGLHLLRKYPKINVICAANGLYSGLILQGIKQLFSEENIPFRKYDSFRNEMMEKGSLFLVLGGQFDTDHLNVLRAARDAGFELGKDVGMITYNDDPINEFVAGGLTCLSTDFAAMGRHAADIINSGQYAMIHNEFGLVQRKSL